MTADLALPVAVVLLHYLAHSSLLLGSAWLIEILIRFRSHALREWLWKTAAVAPLITTTLTFVSPWSRPLVVWTLETERVARNLDERRPTERPAGTTIDGDEPLPSADRIPHNADNMREAEVATAETGDAVVGSHAPNAPAPESALEADFAFDTSATEQAATDIPLPPPAGSEEFTVNEPAIAEPSIAAAPPWRSPAAWRLGAFTVVGLASMLVSCGIAVFLLRFARLAGRFAAATVLAEGPARAALDRLLRRARLRRGVRLVASPRVREPLAFGLLRWTIVLPLDCERRLPRRELEALLAHELAHLVRGDVGWLWISQFLCTCLAFQPLNFLARRRWQAAAEFQCDDWAVGRGVRPLTLANCLAEVASWRIGSRDASPVGLSAAGSHSDVGRRIRRLAEAGVAPDRWSRRPARWTLATASLAVTLAVALLAPRAAWTETGSETDAHDQGVVVAHEAPRRAANSARGALDEHDGDSGLSDDWRDLDQDLRELNDALRRLDAALSREPGDPELAAAAEQLRQRAKRLDANRARLIGRLNLRDDNVNEPNPDSLDSPKTSEPKR